MYRIAVHTAEAKKLSRRIVMAAKPGRVLFRRALWLMLLLSAAALAQITTTTIVGTVTDPTGAALPTASVTARNIDTNLTRTVSTNQVGDYRIEFLPVGNYVLEVTGQGFKKAVRNNISLQVNETARIDVQLEVGQVNDTVTVNEAPPEVDTSTSQIGRTIESTEIVNLPLVD